MKDDAVSRAAVIAALEALKPNSISGTIDTRIIWQRAQSDDCIDAIRSLPAAVAPLADGFEEALDEYLRAEHALSNQFAAVLAHIEAKGGKR